MYVSMHHNYRRVGEGGGGACFPKMYSQITSETVLGQNVILGSGEKANNFTCTFCSVTENLVQTCSLGCKNEVVHKRQFFLKGCSYPRHNRLATICISTQSQLVPTTFNENTRTHPFTITRRTGGQEVTQTSQTTGQFYQLHVGFIFIYAYNVSIIFIHACNVSQYLCMY